MNTTTATPTKLRNGSWGARTSAPVSEGDVVTITTKSGKSWEARVERVVWTDGQVAICATESLDRAPSASRGGSSRRRSRGTWTGCSCGSVEEYSKASDCWTCKHDA